jgi:hypothetical protein
MNACDLQAKRELYSNFAFWQTGRRLEPCHLLGGRRTGWSRRQRISPDQSIQLRIADNVIADYSGDHDPS